jgi:hypothetical protein
MQVSWGRERQREREVFVKNIACYTSHAIFSRKEIIIQKTLRVDAS